MNQMEVLARHLNCEANIGSISSRLARIEAEVQLCAEAGHNVIPTDSQVDAAVEQAKSTRSN